MTTILTNVNILHSVIPSIIMIIIIIKSTQRVTRVTHYSKLLSLRQQSRL